MKRGNIYPQFLMINLRIMSQATHTEAVYFDQLDRSLVFETEPHFQDADFDLLEEAEKKAPKFKIHQIRGTRYLAKIDPYYVAKWDFKFDLKKLSRATGLEAVQVFGHTVAVFKSAFPLATIEEAIKLSFV